MFLDLQNNEANKLKKLGFKPNKWHSDGIEFNELYKHFGNGIMLEICSYDDKHVISLTINKGYCELAIESFEELLSLIKILDK